MPKNKQETSIRRHRPLAEQPLFKLFIVLIVLAAGTFAVLHFTKSSAQDSTPSDSKSDQSQAQTNSKDQKSSTEKTQETSSDSSSTNSTVSPDGKTPAQYDGADPNSSESLTGFLSTSRFDDGGKLILRITIDQYLGGGTCTLSVSDGTHSLERSAAITPVVSTSSCEGFDISASDLANFGRPLSIKISLSSGAKTGTIEGKIE